MKEECGVFLDGDIKALDEFVLGVMFEKLSTILGTPDYMILVLIDTVT